MRFSLNLVEVYNNIANEYDKPLEDYMSYEEFVEVIKKYQFTVVRNSIGDYLVIGIDVEDEKED